MQRKTPSRIRRELEAARILGYFGPIGPPEQARRWVLCGPTEMVEGFQRYRDLGARRTADVGKSLCQGCSLHQSGHVTL
jgi:hypothetical protein